MERHSSRAANPEEKPRQTAAGLRCLCGVVAAGVFAFAAVPVAAVEKRGLEVDVAPAFFNPSLGQRAEIRVVAPVAGELELAILDRDSVPVYSYKTQPLKPGANRLQWAGRDSSGKVVPDEAYYLRIEFDGADGQRYSYDPLQAHSAAPVEARDVTYARRDGVLSYRLSSASRVHIQAGQAVPDLETGHGRGPVLKTIVDRAPRPAGAVVEQWNGLDESGQGSVPDLPSFAVSVLAVPLPENPLIAVGNRSLRFADYVRGRPGHAVQATRHLPSGGGHTRHAGLNALEDRSPRLDLQIGSRTDTTNGGSALRVTATLDPEAAPYFLSQPTQVYVFADMVEVARPTCPLSPCEFAIEATAIPAGANHLAVNWASEFGPVAVAVVRLEKRKGTGEAQGQ